MDGRAKTAVYNEANPAPAVAGVRGVRLACSIGVVGIALAVILGFWATPWQTP